MMYHSVQRYSASPLHMSSSDVIKSANVGLLILVLSMISHLQAQATQCHNAVQEDDTENQPVQGPLQAGQTAPLLLTANAAPALEPASSPFSVPIFRTHREDQVTEVRSICSRPRQSALDLQQHWIWMQRAHEALLTQ